MSTTSIHHFSPIRSNAAPSSASASCLSILASRVAGSCADWRTKGGPRRSTARRDVAGSIWCAGCSRMVLSRLLRYATRVGEHRCRWRICLGLTWLLRSSSPAFSEAALGEGYLSSYSEPLRGARSVKPRHGTRSCSKHRHGSRRRHTDWMISKMKGCSCRS
jgi:hypothetical protein